MSRASAYLADVPSSVNDHLARFAGPGADGGPTAGGHRLFASNPGAAHGGDDRQGEIG